MLIRARGRDFTSPNGHSTRITCCVRWLWHSQHDAFKNNRKMLFLFCFFLSTSMHLLWLLLSISHSQYSVSIQYSTIKHFIFVLKAFFPRSSPHQINVENRIRNCFIMLFYPKASIEHTFCLHLYLTLFWYDYHCFFSFTEVYTILKFDKTIAILFLEIINELRFKLIPLI